MPHLSYFVNDTLGLNGTSVDSAIAQSRSVEEHNVLGDILKRYYSIFLMCFGTIGNGLSLAVLSRKTFRSSPIGIYLRWLAIWDLTALYTGTGYFWALAHFQVDVRDTSALSCRFHRWISYTAVDMSAWILILMTLARLISILYPLRTFCTKLVVYISLFATFAAALLANLPMFVFYGRMKTYSNGVTKCKYFPEYRFFIKEVWNWIVLVKFGLLPVTILIILNTILCIRVFRSSNDMRRMNNNSYTIHNKSPERSSSSGKFGYFIHRLSGRRLMKNSISLPRTNLINISNTDITRMTTTGDMAVSLLQSSEDINRISALNSRYASTEELKKELNETYGIGRDNASLKPQNETQSSTDQEEKKRGYAFIRFAKHVFNTKIRNRKSKYLFSSSSNDTDGNGDVDSASKEKRPLSIASDGEVFQRSQSSSRSRCYDSRNSFHFARDSVQYTKDKQKLASSRQESEELIPGKQDSCSSNMPDENSSLLKQQTNLVCDKHDLKRPTPIFTISSVGSEGSQNVPVILSDGDVGGETSVAQCGTPANKEKLSTGGIECPEDSYFNEESDDSEPEDMQCSDYPLKETDKGSEHAHVLRKDPPSLNTSFEITIPDVADNLRAASKKLQHLSFSNSNSNDEFTSTIPLQQLNKRQSSDGNDLHPDEAVSDSSRRSTGGLLVTDSQLKPGDGGAVTPGRTSACMVSNGLLTPRGGMGGGRGESQLTGSRQSLNVAVARGRTGAGKAKTRNLTATLLMVNLVFIICNIPIVIYMTSRKYLFKDRSINSPGATFELLANFIMYTNNATNFIMYCLTGTRFRMELQAMMKEVLDFICRRKRKRRRISTRRR